MARPSPTPACTRSWSGSPAELGPSAGTPPCATARFGGQWPSHSPLSPSEDFTVPSTSLSHPAIAAVLSTAATLLGMEVVFIGGLTQDSFTFERVRASEGLGWEIPPEGAVLDRAGTLCHRLLGGAPSSTCDAANDPAYSEAAARSQFGITSYVGVPIHDSRGQVVATLCGIDRDHVSVPADVIDVLRQLADVVSAHLGPIVEEGVVI